MFRHTRTLLRVVAPVTKSASTSRIPTFSPRLVAPIKFYSTQGGAQESAATTEDALNHEGATKDSSSASATTELDQKIKDLTKQLEDKSKQLAELKVSTTEANPGYLAVLSIQYSALTLALCPLCRTLDCALWPISRTCKRSRKGKRLKPRTLH